MREVIPVIIRLLADSAHPQTIRGTLQTLNQEEQRSFGDEQELLTLLRQLVAPTRALPDESAKTSGRRDCSSA